MIGQAATKRANAKMDVITQNMVVQATTDDIRQEFKELTEALEKVSRRQDRVQSFTIATSTISEGATHVLSLLGQKEQQHIDHVRETLKRIPEYPKDRNPHDHTKDNLYFFVTSAKYACRVHGPSMDKLFELETVRHYTEEPHHPEFECINGKECDTFDIMEMAVDRMSRNIQFNGHVILDDMKKYLPKFSLGDNEAKQESFMIFVEKYTEITEKIYWEMFTKK